jgi:hypothetical protein
MASEDVVVVANDPLGVKAANRVKINCYVALNTPLKMSDFNGIISKDRIFEKTSMLRKVLCK